MKQKILVLCVLMMSVIQTSATLAPIPLHDYDDLVAGKPHKVPALRPTVMFDDELSQLTITTPYYIDQMTVVIRNEAGDVIETRSFSISDSQTLNLTEDVMNEMYSVELLFGDRHMIGYFMLEF